MVRTNLDGFQWWDFTPIFVSSFFVQDKQDLNYLLQVEIVLVVPWFGVASMAFVSLSLL